jgi:hypothetical protein
MILNNTKKSIIAVTDVERSTRAWNSPESAPVSRTEMMSPALENERPTIEITSEGVTRKILGIESDKRRQRA